MKQKYICDWCGKEIYRYPSQMKGKKMVFCCRQCQADYRSKKHNPEGRPIYRHPELRAYNEMHNKDRMTPEVRGKLRAARLNTGCGLTYEKYYGKAMHRVVAEKILGRPLRPGEVVHHINENKRDNRPENLMVFKSQAEHARWHKVHDKKGGDAAWSSFHIVISVER